MKLKITHSTQYAYDAPVIYGLQQLRLSPQSSVHQTVLNWSVKINGGAEELSFYDHYENKTTLVQAEPGVDKLDLIVSGEVETHTESGIYGKIYSAAPLWHFKQATPRTHPGKGIIKLSKLITGKDDTLAELHALSAAILAIAPYNFTLTSAETTAEDALRLGGGVCQDHAQIFIAAARYAGIPARYVSGYLLMDDRIDQDASHGWAEAHVEGLGWVGFDVSNGHSPDERYVRIATGRDSRDAAPVSGMRLGNSDESLIVSLQIQQ